MSSDPNPAQVERARIVNWLRHSAIELGLTRELRKALADAIERTDYTSKDHGDGS